MGEIVSVTPSTKFESYLAIPEGDAKGAVIVIHEVWGLDDHIKSVADRLAKEGFYALAPDLLGESIDVEALRELQLDLFDAEKRNEVQPKMREMMAPIHNEEFGANTVASLKDCFDYLFQIPNVKQKVFVMGFCFGGSYSFSLATEEPRLKGAAAYYGHADQSVEKLKNIKCPVIAFYGENDERLISSLPDLKSRMDEAGVNFSPKVYPNCGHAFFNDTNKYAYNKEAAEDAWNLTLSLFKRDV